MTDEQHRYHDLYMFIAEQAERYHADEVENAIFANNFHGRCGHIIPQDKMHLVRSYRNDPNVDISPKVLVRDAIAYATSP